MNALLLKLAFSFFFLINITTQQLKISKHKCDETEYDYIVVGSGSSGAVVAARLSEDPDVTVLLLEAGGKPIFPSEVPLISFQALGSKMDWFYETVPQKNCCAAFQRNVIPVNRGKALGGTSSLNFMTYTRGNKKDFDQWKSFGNDGWGYDEIFKYFLKLEDYRVPRTRENDAYHREGGPMTVMIPTFKTPYADAFLQAGHQLGYHTVDYNGKHQIGFMYPPVTIRDGKRCSTYIGYLKPAMKRENLKVFTHALVTKVLINDQKEAIGVVYEINRQRCEIRAKREIILSGGVYNTPQILILSGIGPKEQLEKLKIPVVVDLPGVGENLQDHVLVGGLMYFVNQSNTYNSVRYENEKYLNLWRKTRTGPMTCPESFEGVAYYQTKFAKQDDDWPDIEVFFNSDNTLKLVKKYLTPFYQSFMPSNEKEVISLVPILLRPKSRGTVTLKSKDPHHAPVIDPKYLSHPDDISVLVEGMKFCWRLAETPSFQQYGPVLFNLKIAPLCILYYSNKEAYDRCIVRTMMYTGFHPCCTCKMGPKSDPKSVVDNRLRVHDIKRLRIADASVMPTIVAAHPSTACMMIGEKVSDMIKEDWKSSGNTSEV